MPKLSGPFTQFRNLDKINLGNVADSLKSHGDIHVLENFFGNRILYPQTVPMTIQDMEIDLAILSEAIRLEPAMVMSRNGKSIILTEELTKRFTPTSALIKTIIQSLKLGEITTIYLKKNALTTLIGSIYLPKLNFPQGQKINIYINGQSLKLTYGSFSIFPFQERHLRLKLGTNPEVLLSGGELGLVIDLTINK